MHDSNPTSYVYCNAASYLSSDPYVISMSYLSLIQYCICTQTCHKDALQGTSLYVRTYKHCSDGIGHKIGLTQTWPNYSYIEYK